MKKTASDKMDNPSVRMAKRFVENALGSGGFSAGDRLPTLRDLASSARVSPHSMLKALHLLEADGAVTIVKNHGTYAGKPEDRLRMPDAEALGKPLAGKWQRLRTRLVQDIYSGQFNIGSDLPSLPDLAYRYGTTVPTLRKAIKAMEQDGMLELHGRKYRIPRPAILPGQAGILFTAYLAPAEADLWFQRDANVEFLASLQRACAEANLRLWTSSYHPERGFQWRVPGNAASELRSIAFRGHIAWAPGMPQADLDRFRADLAGLHAGAKPVRIGSRQMPLAILDGGRGMPMSLPASGEYACARVFSTLGGPAGEKVARFLLAEGHRRIAFLSACHQEPWSQARLAGMRRACAAAGFPDAVKAFTLPAGAAPQEMPEPPPDLVAAETEMDEVLAKLEKGLGRQAQAWLALPMKTALEFYRGAVRTALALKDPVERLRAWDPTACVAANHTMALAAMRHWRAAGIPAAEAMTFVGFEDDKLAFGQNLTTYDFNMAHIARSMLRFILAPEKTEPGDRQGVVECQGMLVDRRMVRNRGKARGLRDADPSRHASGAALEVQ